MSDTYYFSINELNDYFQSVTHASGTSFAFNSTFSGTTPAWLKDYYDYLDSYETKLLTDYGDYRFIIKSDTAEHAYTKWYAWNRSWCQLKSPEISKVYEAFRATFDPVENYDRTESTTVTTDMTVDNDTTTSGSNTTSATENASASVYGYDSSTANPSDSSTGTSSGTSSSTGSVTNSVDTDGTVTTTSRIHGNIGVTSAIDLISQSVDYFGNNSFVDFVLGSMVRNSAILLDDDDFNII